MTQKLLTLPFRLGFGAARTAFDISAKTLDVSTTLARVAIGTIRSSAGDDSTSAEAPQRDGSSQATAAPPTEASPAETTEAEARPVPERRQRGESRVNGHSATPPAPPAPVTPPDELPDTPLTHEQEVVKTLEDEEELVAEFAEPGAEDGAGAQLEVDEPWAGYAQMNAGTVVARIDQADAAELALLELYEQMHKRRQTVLAAAAKRLRALSAPEAAPETE